MVPYKCMRGYGHLTRQILELLSTGALFGFIKDKNTRRTLLREADRIWYSIDRKQLFRALERLKLNGYVALIKKSSGIQRVHLTNRGRAKSLAYQFYSIVLPRSKKWDKKWRIVLFDIPEPKKKIRDALRRKLKELGFLEFQKSVFVYPYSCGDEMNFVINFYGIPEEVYYLEAPIVSDDKLRQHFKLK
jgi:DNA-binding transcriptional regulator PaaX